MSIGLALLIITAAACVACVVLLTWGNKKNYPAPEGSEAQLRNILGYVINNTNFDWQGARITSLDGAGHICVMEFPQRSGSKFTYTVGGPMEIYSPASAATYNTPYGPRTVRINTSRRVGQTRDPLIIKIGNELAEERERKRQERWKNAKGPIMEVE